jgi:hypothetical protein
MSNDNDDLDKMSLGELRKLKEEVLSRIDAAGVETGGLSQVTEGAEEIRGYYALLRKIEARLDIFEKGAP